MTTEASGTPENTPTEQTPAAPTAAAPAAPALEVGATPATPAAPAAEPAQAAPAFAKTGDAALDVALDFFAKAGIAPESTAMQLAATGDFSLLRAELAQKGKAGGEQFVAIAEQAYQRAAKESEAKVNAARDAVLGIVGGAEAWVAISDWAGQNLPAAKQAEVNAAFKQGGLVAEATAVYLKNAYEASSGAATAKTGAADPAGNARSAGAPVSGGPLSGPEFSKAIAALVRTHKGGRMEESDAYKSLVARRRAYRG